MLDQQLNCVYRRPHKLLSIAVIDFKWIDSLDVLLRADQDIVNPVDLHKQTVLVVDVVLRLVRSVFDSADELERAQSLAATHRCRRNIANENSVAVATEGMSKYVRQF